MIRKTSEYEIQTPEGPQKMRAVWWQIGGRIFFFRETPEV